MISWPIYLQQYGQYIGNISVMHTAHISAVCRQYVAPAPKPDVGHTVSDIMSTLVPYIYIFFFQSVGHM